MGMSINILTVISIICNALALFKTGMAKNNQYRELYLQHQRSLSGYQLIAQKIRRLDKTTLDITEIEYLIRHLEESFETHKAYAHEPPDEDFKEGAKYMQKLNSYPFGVKSKDIKC